MNKILLAILLLCSFSVSSAELETSFKENIPLINSQIYTFNDSRSNRANKTINPKNFQMISGNILRILSVENNFKVIDSNDKDITIQTQAYLYCLEKVIVKDFENTTYVKVIKYVDKVLKPVIDSEIKYMNGKIKNTSNMNSLLREFKESYDWKGWKTEYYKIITIKLTKQREGWEYSIVEISDLNKDRK
jgi:hypothetical protein